VIDGNGSERGTGVTHEELVAQVAEFVVEASEGAVSRENALRPGLTFPEMGLTSLAYLRLIDSVETRLGMYFDLEDESGSLETVAGVVDYVMSQRAHTNG
jgi:acyl carrier protein